MYYTHTYILLYVHFYFTVQDHLQPKSSLLSPSLHSLKAILSFLTIPLDKTLTFP